MKNITTKWTFHKSLLKVIQNFKSIEVMTSVATVFTTFSGKLMKPKKIAKKYIHEEHFLAVCNIQ
jgi:hypothetical protein